MSTTVHYCHIIKQSFQLRHPIQRAVIKSIAVWDRRTDKTGNETLLVGGANSNIRTLVLVLTNANAGVGFVVE